MTDLPAPAPTLVEVAQDDIARTTGAPVQTERRSAQCGVCGEWACACCDVCWRRECECRGGTLMDKKQRLELAKTIPGATTRFGWTNCIDDYDIAGLAARTGRVAQITAGADKGRHLYEVELLILHASSDAKMLGWGHPARCRCGGVFVWAQISRYRSGGVFVWADSPACPRHRITHDRTEWRDDAP